MKKYICAMRTSFGVLLLTLIVGCTHNVKIAVTPTALPTGTKIDAKAGLLITEELRNYTYEFSRMGDKWVFPFGPALQEYSQQLANSTFSQVDVLGTESGSTLSDLLLVPRPVKIEQSTPVFAWEDVRMTMAIEWLAKDRASKNTVWLKTITAEAAEAGGNAFTGSSHQQKLLQKLFDDLSLKTYEALQSSAELKRFGNR